MFPKLKEVINDPNQKDFETRVNFMKSMSKDKSFCRVNEGALLMYDGIIMYRGSLPWYYWDSIPIFYDLGECIRDNFIRVDLNSTEEF